MLEVGSADRRGPFRTERQRAPAAVIERVHLLLDDVGRLADPAREQLGGLERRRFDPSVARRLEDPRGVGFERGAACRIGGEHIERASGGLDHAHEIEPEGLILVREFAQERIRVALLAERRDPHVAGVDDRLGRVRADQ